MHPSDSSAVAAVAAEPSLSLWERTVAIFARPTEAWSGLRPKAQWWFPLLLVLSIGAVSLVVIYERAVLPMMVAQWEQAVDAGRMTAEGVEGARSFMSGPAGAAIAVIQQVIFVFLFQLLAALLIWFGCGFVLGAKLSYRLALEVACWAALVTIPNTILSSALGAMRENIAAVHTGFGILVATDEPSRLMTGLGVFLDAIGPFAIWYLAVIVIGASALSGARRGSVAWVLGAIYLTVALLMSVGAAMTAPTG